MPAKSVDEKCSSIGIFNRSPILQSSTIAIYW